MPQKPSPFLQAPPQPKDRQPLDPTPLSQTNPGLAKIKDFISGLFGLNDPLSPQTTPAEGFGMAGGALLGAPLLGGAIKKVWHGSPKAWDAVEISPRTVGKEGGSTFTPGFYASDLHGVAKTYAVAPAEMGEISTRPVSQIRNGIPNELVELAMALKVPTAVAPETQGIYKALTRSLGYTGIDDNAKLEELIRRVYATPAERLNEIFAFKQGRPEGPGYLYDMRMDVDPERVATWNTHVLQQPKPVRAAIYDLLDEAGLHDWMPNTGLMSGVMGKLHRDLAQPSIFPQLMRERGVQALQYPVGSLSQTKHAGDGWKAGEANNYVVYDPAALAVVKRMVAPGGKK